MSAPRHSIFISYRRLETAFAVDKLDRALRHAFGKEAVFRDVESIRKGQSFPDDIRAALAEARVGLVMIGPWWLTVGADAKDPSVKPRLLDPTDWVRQEVESLLKRESAPGQPIPVIPLYTGGASAPRAADLPDSLKPLAPRDGMKLDAHPDTDHSIGKIIDHLAEILGVTPQPAAPVSPAAEEKPPRIGGSVFSVTGKKFVGREQELHLLDEAWGRSKPEDKINIVSLIGQGGEGKSALVLEWQARRARHGWQGARRVFVWSFYSQGTSAQSSASADDFFNAAFAWFDPAVEAPKDSTTKGAKLAELIAAERTLLVLDGLEPLQQPPGGFGGEFKDPAMKALLRGLALHNPGLCVLTSRTDITDLASYEHADGSCLRYQLHSLDPAAARALLRELGVLGPDRELDEAAAWFHRHAYDLNLLGNYLRECTDDHDIRGWEQRFPILQEDENIHPVPDAQGKRAGHGVRMLRAYERWLGGSSPAHAILRLLGLFDRPVRSDLLDELRAAPVIRGLTETLVELPEAQWKRALAQLEQLALIYREPLSLPAGKVEVEPVTVSSDEVSDEVLDALLHSDELPEEIKKLPRAELKQLLAGAMSAQKNPSSKPAVRPRRAVTFALDTHPLLREHFGAELRAAHEVGRREGHRRLYTYLCETTPDKPQPTLEDLQPLYQAVAHGCQAGLQQEACDEVYFARIQRGNEAYSVRKLGAFGSDLGAVACFFAQTWSRISPGLTEPDQAWLLNQAAAWLRALGRLTESLEPVRAGLENYVKQENWKHAAILASNLSELELTLGEVAGAVGDAEQSVTYADRSGDASQRMINRTTHADALHQAGRWAEAEARFREAERQPAYPLLYSTGGFRYCDLLLAEAERASWGKDEGGRMKDELIAACRAVSERAAQTLKWVESWQKAILDIALDHLTLGRAALYEGILKGKDALPRVRDSRSDDDGKKVIASPAGTSSSLDATLRVPTDLFETARRELDAAVSGLRRAGAVEFLVRGLLTRAWLRFLAGARTGPESVQEDLDEAWEVAERGPMKLFMADIHLYRARLFFREAIYPWKVAKNWKGELVTNRTAQDDLKDAEHWITACGYHRRDAELADAKAALLG
jgi:tetratricopeptide (TPR) repeat protein